MGFFGLPVERRIAEGRELFFLLAIKRFFFRDVRQLQEEESFSLRGERFSFQPREEFLSEGKVFLGA